MLELMRLIDTRLTDLDTKMDDKFTKMDDKFTKVLKQLDTISDQIEVTNEMSRRRDAKERGEDWSKRFVVRFARMNARVATLASSLDLPETLDSLGEGFPKGDVLSNNSSSHGEQSTEENSLEHESLEDQVVPIENVQ